MGYSRTRTLSNHHCHVLSRNAWCYCRIWCHFWRVLRQCKKVIDKFLKRLLNSKKIWIKFALYRLFRWLHEIDQNCDVVNRILVGNKNDDPDRKVVLSEDARRFAQQMGIKVKYILTSEESLYQCITSQILAKYFVS